LFCGKGEKEEINEEMENNGENCQRILSFKHLAKQLGIFFFGTESPLLCVHDKIKGASYQKAAVSSVQIIY
jgi:hypothetical protein